MRGQAEAKEEVRRVVSIWQSGEAFERAGGKRERGLLFLGAPGTGKTMLAKAIATGFNSPFISMPGSGFAATFIGIDAIIVRVLARRAKKLARKWGGQCIVFIDEIDAVGMRRQALQQCASMPLDPTSAGSSRATSASTGRGARGTRAATSIIESRRWRERLFEQRAPAPMDEPARAQRIVNQFPGGMFGGDGRRPAGAQPAARRHGRHRQPAVHATRPDEPDEHAARRLVHHPAADRQDAACGSRAARPRGDQIYFIGATNVPLDVLDPALTRPGRMGRHVLFRTPTKDDRKDVFDLYLGKVAHDPDLDTPKRRDEIARITNGYSPAMIDQVCSMALTNAQHEGAGCLQVGASGAGDDDARVGNRRSTSTTSRTSFARSPIHEAGHAAAAHVYRPSSSPAGSRSACAAARSDTTRRSSARSASARWQHEEMGDLIHGLGAMAAENVFYGENTSGVGGDLQTATAILRLDGRHGRACGLSASTLSGAAPKARTEDEAREKSMQALRADRA